MKRLFGISFSFFSLLLFGFSPFLTYAYASDWPIFQLNPQHTGYSADETTLKPNLNFLWSRPNTSGFGGQVVSGTTLYTKDGTGFLYSIDTTTSNINWKVQTTSGGETAFANNTVYAANFNTSIDAFNPSTGQKLWTNSFPAFGITAVGNVVYAGSLNNHVRAIDGSSGNTLWDVQIADGVYATPAVVNGIVYVGTFQSSFYALDASTGAVVWKTPPSSLQWPQCWRSSPTVVNNVIYVGNECAGGVYALDANSGNQIWHTSNIGNTSASMSYANGVVYTQSDAGIVYAIDASTGATLWSYDSGSSSFGNSTIPLAIANGVVYQGNSSNTLNALDAQTGALLWQYNTGAVGRTIIANHMLLVGSNNGLYAFAYDNPQITVNPITVSASLVQANSTINFSATFTDVDTTHTHTATWIWGDGTGSVGTFTESNGSGSVSDSHTYTATGVYTPTLIVTDNNGGTGISTFQYIAVYDASTSFAGGRSFDNPASASPNTTGKVTFGISAKFNNSNVLTGSVKMNFKAANLDLVSTSLQSLGTSNGKAYLKGNGTLNGNSGYTFLATGIDGSVAGGNDLIRFQIKDSSNTVVYDSQPGASDTTDPTTLDATGNIRIH